MATAAATLQTSCGDVQREGLPAVLPAGFSETLPRVLPARFSKALEAPLAHKVAAGQKRHRTQGKLHRVIRDEKRTEWSRAGQWPAATGQVRPCDRRARDPLPLPLVPAILPG